MTEIETKSIDDLLPDPNNVNRHTQRGHGLVENSIRRRGVGRGILAAGKNTEKPVIMAGNLTHEKARDAGIDEVVFVHTTGNQLVVNVRDDLDPTSPEAIALGIEDNESGKLSYNPDIDLLAAMSAGDNGVLSELKKQDKIFGGMLEGMGVKDAEPVDAEPQIDRAAELQAKWHTATGQLWKLGEHRLLIGNCTVRENVERLMGGERERAGACVTDSPYGINREGIENDDPEGLRALFDGCLAVMPIDNGVVINFQSPRLFPVWLDAVRSAGHKFERALWMYITNDMTFPWRGWLLKSELISLSSVGGAEWVDVHPYHDDCYLVDFGKMEVEGLHTTVKTLSVVQDLISRVGGSIFDPFAGSGTTIIAAHNLNRRCYAMEISPNYGGVILERFYTATGIQPELVTE